MQFKVPQNIDMQDKIIGPLTMAQFLYLLIGGMTDYVLLQTVYPTQPAIFFVVAIPIALFALSMTFVKINDIPFPKFVQAALLFLAAPKVRMWHKVIDITTPIKIEATKQKDKPKIIKKKIEKSEIEQLASVLDTAGWAAVRDQHLKDFVTTFDEKHHSLQGAKSEGNSQHKAPNPKPQIASTK